MSKLYSQYIQLKSQNPNTVYLFKCGIFYIALDKDAYLLSNKMGFKLTNLNQTILKCGFPVNRLDYYSNLLDSCDINFEIIDNTCNNIDNYLDYLNNMNVKEIIDSIINIDFNNITFKQAFDILYNTSNDLKEICKN